MNPIPRSPAAVSRRVGGRPQVSKDRAPEPDRPGRSRGEKARTAWREARALIWARRGRLGLGLLLLVVGRLAALVLPASSKYFIDDVIGKGAVDLLPKLALAAGAATLIQALSSFALSRLLGVAAQRAINELRIELQQHVSRLPVSYFDSTKTGTVVTRVMNDAEGIRNLVGTGLVELIGGLFTALLALSALLYLNWRLTLVNLIALAAFGGLMAFTFGRLRPLFRKRSEIYGEIGGRLAESIGGVRVVKTYTAEKREALVFAKGAHKLFRNVAKTMTSISAVSATTGILVGAIGLSMMLVGGRAILAGTMTLGDFVAYLFFTGLLAAPLVQVASIGTQLTEAFAGLDRIHEVRGLATEDAGDAAREPVGTLRGDVEFDAVAFEYKAGEPVLRGISFVAPAGSTTALVGPSGSGKTTILSLVLAFHRPQGGRILVDGRDLERLRLRDYRAHLGVVMQDNFLFDGTVAENIAYSRPGATRAEIEAAAAVAHCDEFVRGFEKGYDTVVGERGVKLSGGQRQRVAIARAILADPTILILDEATSSLDSESEALIQDGLRSLRRGRTTFVIAHRLSTIRSADQILVVEKGEIVERGTHRALLAAGGRYKQLHDRQYRLEEDLFVNPGEDFPEPAAAVAEVVAGPRGGGRSPL
jgi:subfamily B ATP-binding cassette protein MsbA